MPLSRRTVLARTVVGSATLAAAATVPVLAERSGARAAAAPDSGGYEIGVGLSDITGPAAECGMMGYSQFEQQTAGIHLRPRARAFIIGAGGRRIVFVVAENGMIFQSVHRGVLTELARRFGDQYTEQNVLLTSTHSHATCGGSSNDYAYNLSIMGFQQQVYNAEVNGIVEAVAAAHADLGPGALALGRGELHDASVNRSRVAWELNPIADKQHFPEAIDPAVTVLSLVKGGRQVGAITWFATHNTSMTNQNRLISADNKGYAAFSYEHLEHGVRYLDGDPGFVAAFAQTNAGDMSPNLNLRPGSGPTEDEFENTRIIGERQYRASKDALAQARSTSGPVDALLCYIDLADIAVDGRFTPDGQPRHTAPAAAGVSLIAGSIEDGPGLPGVPIPEGVRNPFLQALGDPNTPAPAWLADAQAPKAIAAPLGLLPPVAWVPNVLPIQLVRIGELYLAAAGGEFTITAGLRVRRAVADALGVPLEQVLMQGYANAYHEYVTTPEEYDAQQYEGASTLFGRYTLGAYQQEFTRLATAFAARQQVPRGPAPRDVSHLQPNFQPGAGPDTTPPGRAFGDVLIQPAPVYGAGAQVVAEFVSAHPKHNPRRNGTFLEVQRRNPAGDWIRVANEGEWAVKFHWSKRGAADSVARFTWDIPADATPGRYRLQHYADSLSPDGALHPFTGTSNDFEVR
ncbi:putative ceramidase [Nocardia brasiliensis NBRC 14402]|uniref:neutral/alkaline ceramidase n=1 Tax=Nocardia brasiliensis TaxID=37326 RepID=UPI000305F329|nr:neutral/alkaline ceramidase [Nocardia brasiliensis]ASF10233.1 alkaline ceramidase [Nocardia brasiliensis]GAJ79384.1 putative ceramidase [Nocardia brasiliensis NBRC 14402]SUB11316.1 Neutral ceramidase precursor [Nocardia brasiliensis]